MVHELRENRHKKALPIFNELRPYHVGYEPDENLKRAYLEYIGGISTPVWAMSWELATYMDRLIQSTDIKRILDLGSGFSSFVFRRTGREVTSVDDSPEWLVKTRRFLEGQKVSTERLFLLTDFKFGCHYDLTLLDLGRVENDRVPLFEPVRAHSGMIILDDMHYADYRRQAKQFFKNDLIIDLTLDTKDTYGRYSWLVIPRHYWHWNTSTREYLFWLMKKEPKTSILTVIEILRDLPRGHA
jgi:hypothetical protein